MDGNDGGVGIWGQDRQLACGSGSHSVQQTFMLSHKWGILSTLYVRTSIRRCHEDAPLLMTTLSEPAPSWLLGLCWKPRPPRPCPAHLVHAPPTSLPLLLAMTLHRKERPPGDADSPDVPAVVPPPPGDPPQAQGPTSYLLFRTPSLCSSPPAPPQLPKPQTLEKPLITHLPPSASTRICILLRTGQVCRGGEVGN